MRISYSVPDHIKFGLTVEQWSRLVNLTGETIDWLDEHDDMYDVWLLVAYAATACALVQVRRSCLRLLPIRMTLSTIHGRVVEMQVPRASCASSKNVSTAGKARSPTNRCRLEERLVSFSPFAGLEYDAISSVAS
jgi:hypothetical protein